MSDGIYSALSGAVAQQKALDVVANNVANVGTVGYRGDRLAFREALSRSQGAPVDSGLRFVAIRSLETNPENGPLEDTGNPLDLALQGDGLAAVETPAGVRYTRALSLVMDADGFVRTRQGHKVLLNNRDAPYLQVPVNAPPTNPVTGNPIEQALSATLQVQADGSVWMAGQPLGTLRIERFAEGGLVKEGLTLYAPERGTEGEPAAETQVIQGFLERANFSPIGGMNELISASRAFDAFQRVIRAFRDIDQRTARDVGSPT